MSRVMAWAAGRELLWLSLLAISISATFAVSTAVTAQSGLATPSRGHRQLKEIRVIAGGVWS